MTSISSFSTTTTATGTGDWDEGGTWDNGIPGCFDTIVIPAGVTVTITSTVDLTGCPPIYIEVQGELHFQTGKKLDLPLGSIVYMVPGPPPGTLTGGGGGGSSNWIDIGGTTYWSAGDGDLTGPVALCASCSMLPIELLYFTATDSDYDRQVDLNWETASETDNDYFTIERSANGADWIEIADVDGAGTSSINIKYHEVDKNALFGNSYYRLKQTDLNGEFDYSPIVQVNQNNIQEIKLYPNPANSGDEVVLNFPSGHESNVDVNILSIDGKLVYQATFDISETHQVIIDIGVEFIPGLYLVKTNLLTAKLVVK
jgi:hypothetical protein